jgi:DNA polymerase III delta prime subunit|tara:strand:- start:5299 stop:6267 length:969 start_codon:yes stop_codon:yes gene_type:complete
MQKNIVKNCIPWSEKYRPIGFQETILDPINRSIFENIIERKQFPNILLYGPPGVGKTTSAINLIKAYQQKYYRPNKETVIHLNASDERGIELIRNQIFNFVRSCNMFESGLKFVILDEVDYMTKNAQQALKNLLQSSYKNVRFCLICNYICKIEHSLLNEFVCIRFNKLPDNEIENFFKVLIDKEKLKISTDFIQKMKTMFHTDIRSMVNYLQLHHSEEEQHCFNSNNYDFYESLHNMFVNHTDEKHILQFIYKYINVQYNIDLHSFIKDFFHYIISNHKDFVEYHFLNIAETIVHEVNDNDCIVNYFVYQLSSFHKNRKLK